MKLRLPKPQSADQSLTGREKFRTRWSHIVHIDGRIRSGRKPNCTQLATELEVSRRTILRDIEFMRYTLGAPIDYHGQDRGYFYREKSWVMPSVRLSEGDLFALMIAGEVMETYADMPWAARLREALNRISCGMPGPIELAPDDLRSRIRFSPGSMAPVKPEILDVVQQAIRENRVLRLRYYVLWRGHEKDFLIEPYLIRRAHGAWYLVGRDQTAKRVPLLALSRVRRAELTDETFDYHEAKFDADAYFADTFAVMHGPLKSKCIIEFTGIAAQLVRERVWHSSQKLREIKPDKVRLELTVSHLDDLWPWVLSWGRLARVIAPMELVERIREEAKAVAGACESAAD